MRRVNALAARSWACAALVALCTSCEQIEQLTESVGDVVIGDVPQALAVGSTGKLSLAVLDASGKPLSGKPVYWMSRDTGIVRVDSTGTVRARVPGTARIVAGSEDKHDEITIVVPNGPRLDFNTIVPDTLSGADDADEWTFEADEGQLVNVFLAGLSGVATHQFRLRLIGPGGNTLDSMVVLGTESAMRTRAIRWFRLPQDGVYRLRVEGSFGTDNGNYQLMVEAVDPAPETAPSTIIPGTTVTTESLAPGDIDTFTFDGTTGQEISVQFLAKSGKSEDALKLLVYAPNGSEMVFIHSNGDYAAFQPSGRLLLEQNGTYIVRVEGEELTDGGSYHFMVARINRAPEQGPTLVALNEVFSETISPVGDVDEFTLSIPSLREFNVYLQSMTGVNTDTVVLRILAPSDASTASLTSTGRDAALETRAISHLTLPPQTYRVRVEGGKSTQGAYRFLVRPINLAPEQAPGAYSLGSIVSNESISPVGDVDHFTFRGTAQSMIRISFRALSGSVNDVLLLRLMLPGGGEHRFVQANGSQGEQIFTTTLPQTGEYRIRVQGVNSSDDAGPYRFQLLKVN